MTNAQQPTMKRSYVLPIVVMFFLFAMISFVTGFQNPFGVILKEQLTLNNFQSQLGNLANFAAYAFMGLPAGLMLQKKGYKFSAVMAVLVGLAGVCLMFVSSLCSDNTVVFIIYLTGAFVAGFSMCMLNTVVNPMLNTLGGGGKRGNQLIQFGGSCNSLAATICPVLVGYLLGSSMQGKTLVDAWPALFIAMGIFVVALLVLMSTKLPEPLLEEQKIEGKKADKPSLKKAFRFPNYVMGVVAIFLYVGVEVGIPNFANLYMTAPTMEQANAKIAEYQHQQSDAAYTATLEEHKVITDDEFGISQRIVSGELYSGLGMAGRHRRHAGGYVLVPDAHRPSDRRHCGRQGIAENDARHSVELRGNHAALCHNVRRHGDDKDSGHRHLVNEFHHGAGEHLDALHRALRPGHIGDVGCGIQSCHGRSRQIHCGGIGLLHGDGVRRRYSAVDTGRDSRLERLPCLLLDSHCGSRLSALLCSDWQPRYPTRQSGRRD